MAKLVTLANRLHRSAVVWSWVFNFLRLSAGLLILPLLLKKLSDEDLGMYYVFLRLIALVPLIDFGFSVSIGRNVSYAMGGASKLHAQGLSSQEAGDGPNSDLLWQLLTTSRNLYALLSLAAFLLLGAGGSWMVGASVGQTLNPTLTWIAWGVSLLAATSQLYAGWWNTFLRGADKVVLAARYAVLGYAIQIGIACVLLMVGGGLLSLPSGMLVGTVIQRGLSRRACLRMLGNRPSVQDRQQTWQLMKTLWPNSWRIGVQYLGNYLGNSIPPLVFASQFGLAVFAPYGVSFQILTICSGAAMVWMQVKWPQVGQLRARQDLPALRRLLWPRFWLQNTTFLFLAAAAILVGPLLLEWIGGGKELLPRFWLVMLATTAFLELQFTFWGTLLSTENRVPYLLAAVVTQIVALLLFLLMSQVLGLDYAALVLAPLVAGLIFNYWFWALAGAQSAGTTLTRFLIRRF
jgi:O-antigen/teichoic acid export membrane protein